MTEPSHEARRAFAPTARHRLVLRLRGYEREDTQALADLLDSCRPQRPCCSAACPVCGMVFQQAAVAVQERVIGQPARAVRHRKHALTIVPGEGCFPPAGLTLASYLWVRSRIEAAMVACDLPPNLFAIDVSFNEDLTGRMPPHWSVHGDGIGLDSFPKPKAAALRKFFPRTPYVSRPVLPQDLDYEDEAILYAYKCERVRRVTEAAKPGERDRRKPKRRDLRPWQSVQLALVEHAAGFRGRLIGHKIDKSELEGLLCAFEWPRDGP